MVSGMDDRDGAADQAADVAKIADAKKALRARIRADRATIDAAERARRDEAIVDHLLTALTGVGPVAAFAGLAGEPGGPGLPASLHNAGHEVWLPVVAQVDSPLHWRRFRGPGTTRRGKFGIEEPAPGPDGEPDLFSDQLFSTVEALVVPALAVDKNGVRLGQGGGFYDRSVAECPKDGKLIVIVDQEEFQVAVPQTDLDIAVPTVITHLGAFLLR